MKDSLIKLEKILKIHGIRIIPDTVKDHRSQGLMSKVFIADSNKGKLILHLGRMSHEQRRQKIWQKINGVSALLGGYSNIPAAKVLASGSFADKYFIAQEMLKGQPAGNRKILKNNKVIDTWHINRGKLEPQILKLLKLINRIKINGAGWLIIKNGKIQGMYKNWNIFLDRETKLWIKGINKKETSPILGCRILNYYKKAKKDLKCNKSFLLHNDLVNPSNILINKNKISGLIDWEWALAGDPAWEFAFNNKYNLNIYFRNNPNKYSLNEQRDFKKRAGIYEVLYLAWGLYIHAKDSDPRVYRALKKHLLAPLLT